MDRIVSPWAGQVSSSGQRWLNRHSGYQMHWGDFDGRSVAFADYDNDSDMDLCVSGDVDALTRLWRNDTINNNHWITVNLTGACSNRSGSGRRIEVTTDVCTTVKEVSSGAGRGSFNGLPVEFGLAEATAIEEIKIFWPSGIEQRSTIQRWTRFPR